jgi:hypothetical protein
MGDAATRQINVYFPPIRSKRFPCKSSNIATIPYDSSDGGRTKTTPSATSAL